MGNYPLLPAPLLSNHACTSAYSMSKLQLHSELEASPHYVSVCLTRKENSLLTS